MQGAPLGGGWNLEYSGHSRVLALYMLKESSLFRVLTDG